MKTRTRMMMAIATALALSVQAQTSGKEEVLPPSEGSSPMGLALLPVRYCEAPGPNSDVWAFRLSLLSGCNRTMTGLDVGSLGNWSKGDMSGIGLAGGYNYCGGVGRALHLALVNYTGEDHAGGQIGLVNTTWRILGLQVGLVNATGEGGGIQLGVYNMAEDFSGLQLGLVNMNLASPMRMMPILNVWF